MSTTLLLAIIVIVVLIAVLPTWPHSRTWGYTPLGAVIAVLVIALLLRLLGVI